MSEDYQEAIHGMSPGATGPGGPHFEGKVGAFYLLSLLGSGEPRGLPGARADKIKFQQASSGRPFDDVTVDGSNSDGSKAFLDIQAKTKVNFTRSDTEFADIVRRVWESARKPEFEDSRYELAIAIAPTSTKIEQHCQRVLFWARQVTSGSALFAQIERPGFSSKAMRDFVEAFRHHLTSVGAETDDETVWGLLRRLQILLFDFESPGSDYEMRAKERARAVLAPEQGARAAELWSTLIDKALSLDSAGGETDRISLIRDLEQSKGFAFGERYDLRVPIRKMAESSRDALADIKDDIGGARLSREHIVERAFGFLEQNPVLYVSGASGVGKSALLKQLAEQAQSEGSIVVLAPGRIVGGGWLNVASAIGCNVGRVDLFNDLGCGGNATIFVDNVDQIESAGERSTLHDLLRAVTECTGWRAVLTVRSDNLEWQANLPNAFRALPSTNLRMGDLTDAEAAALRDANPRLAVLLAATHPARAIARNLFHLSRMIRLGATNAQGDAAFANEIDLARAWWRHGGGRSDDGKWERLKLLRGLGGQMLESPGQSAFGADLFESRTIAELIRLESLREDRAGATVAFWHDTLRDWTIAFLLEEQPDRLKTLDAERPLPAALARGMEIRARLTLDADETGESWLSLLRDVEQDGRHGSWRRPVLLALPRSDNAIALLDRLETPLVADKACRLRELIRLMIAVESLSIAEIVSRLQSPTLDIGNLPTDMVIAAGPSWAPLVCWVVARLDRLPSAAIPDVTKLFQLWLLTTHAQELEINNSIVEALYGWLTRIEEAMRPIAVRDGRDLPEVDLDFGHMQDVNEDVRMTFLSFCHLRPDLAARYLSETDPGRHHEARAILRFPGSAARAAPAALVDFALSVIIPKQDALRSRRRDFGPFGVFDIMDYASLSPGQGPFFELLDHAPAEGLRLVREIVEYATEWYREEWRRDRHSLPVLTIPFPGGPKSFEGSFEIYQWARGGMGPLVAASALMALEAWGHREIEKGRPFSEVLHDVLGPSGSSVSFVCVAVDLALSHWGVVAEAAWPLLASAELLYFDHNRWTRDVAGVARFDLAEPEPAAWKVKRADLVARPSRRCQLTDAIGVLTLEGPVELHGMMSAALGDECKRIESLSHPSDGDALNGLHATAQRALRMSDTRNWMRKTVTQDGREIQGYQFQPTAEEEARLEEAREPSNANVADLVMRLRLQEALADPAKSNPTIVAEGVAWARTQPTVPDGEDEDDFDRKWRARAIVTAAAIAGRDAEGPEREELLAWALPVLQEAATSEDDDLSSYVTKHVWSNTAAIAAVGFAGIYCKSRDTEARDTLLVLASRQEQSILHALGNELSSFSRIDDRFVQSLVRIILGSAVRPRHGDVPEQDQRNREAFAQHVKELIEAEKQWLSGALSQPPWPHLVGWQSRRKRGIRIAPDPFIEEIETEQEAPPEFFIDEHAIGTLASHLLPLSVGEEPDWIISFGRHLMGWTIDANNGPPGDDQHDRENRPCTWNAHFFGFLGTLCAALPFARAQQVFIEPLTHLHDEAYCDAMAWFLRAFDHASLAIGTRQPENAAAVRAVLVERLQRSRMMRYLNDRHSFSTERHLADALNALFFQQPNWASGGRPYIPKKWLGLVEHIPVLMPVVNSAPLSGYLTVMFLSLVESFPCAALASYVVQVFASRCEAYGADPGFWSEHDLGARFCAWFDNALTDDPGTVNVFGQLGAQLGQCLDVMVRAGVPSARTLEARIAEE